MAEKLPSDDDEDGVLAITVRRKFLLEDALREGRKKKFNPHKHLKVISSNTVILKFGAIQYMHAKGELDSCIIVLHSVHTCTLLKFQAGIYNVRSDKEHSYHFRSHSLEKVPLI